jgi:hypothetical protein
MADFSIFGGGIPDAGVSPDTVGGQITTDADPSIGRIGCYVLADGGVDEGFTLHFRVPDPYVGSPVVVIEGVLDGAPGAADTLGFGFRKRVLTDNAAAYNTLDAEQLASATIGSGGLDYADRDYLVMLIPLTGAVFATGNRVIGYVFLDSSATTYTGNFLPLDVRFQYADA